MSIGKMPFPVSGAFRMIASVSHEDRPAMAAGRWRYSIPALFSVS